MFGRNKINLEMINPSSKISLKMSCLQACNNDVEKAEKLYKFMSEGVESIPDFDVPKPGVVQQATQAIDSLFGWLDNNEERIMKGFNFIQAIRGRGGVPMPSNPPVDVPPLPGE